MIWILKVELKFGPYADNPWEGHFEIESTDDLENLQFAINEAIEFDHDHMYEFYISKKINSRNRTVFDTENEEVYRKTIESIFPLEKGMKLFYLFDYGDNWLFQITKSRKKPYAPKEGVKYPRLLKSIGIIPEQYPNFDCDDEI
jgi:hypothetical protein